MFPLKSSSPFPLCLYLVNYFSFPPLLYPGRNRLNSPPSVNILRLRVAITVNEVSLYCRGWACRGHERGKWVKERRRKTKVNTREMSFMLILRESACIDVSVLSHKDSNAPLCRMFMVQIWEIRIIVPAQRRTGASNLGIHLLESTPDSSQLQAEISNLNSTKGLVSKKHHKETVALGMLFQGLQKCDVFIFFGWNVSQIFISTGQSHCLDVVSAYRQDVCGIKTLNLTKYTKRWVCKTF